MELLSSTEPISCIISDAVFGVGQRNIEQFDDAVKRMLSSPLPYDVIMMMGIYEFAKTTGINLSELRLYSEEELGEKIAEYPATLQEITPGLEYIARLQDDNDKNDIVTSRIVESLAHLLWLFIFRITGDDRFELGTLSMSLSIEMMYHKHLESSLNRS